MNNLYLTIKESYFSEILAGTKTTEYREVKPFWTSRLYDSQGHQRKYDGVLFKAGYDPGVPEMVVEYLGVKKVKDTYHIKLGKVLTKKNLKKAASKTSKNTLLKRTEPASTADGIYIQYHNADKIGRFPFTRRQSLELETPDVSYKGSFGIDTTKPTAEKAIGCPCLMIVGVGGKDKRYYLWSYMTIEKVRGFKEYTTSGKGYNLSKGVLLNAITGFDDFKNFCGNFGIGFQRITNHPFHKKLLQLAQKNKT